MKSPKDMRILQIDITNACIHQCSNCTRFCGHHKKPYFMDFETFKMAVDSYEGFERCVGIIGGEPTLHPEFSRFVEYLGQKFPSLYKIEASKKPVSNLGAYIHDKNYILDEMLNRRKGPGLWSSACESYYQHFEEIQDIFSFQNINDHDNNSLHFPMLVSRKEMGIGDEEWKEIRDNCFIQNQWSATITPKGAFFCEVAAALDMLFDGPGGWKIEKGWWKREPEEFGEQLKWCEICGGAFMHNGRLSNEEIDDVSPQLYEMLKAVESPKLKRGRVMVMDMDKPDTLKPMLDTANCYLKEHNERVSKDNKRVYPHQIKGIVADGDKIGVQISEELYKLGNDWLICSETEGISEDIMDRLKKVIINPGVLYKLDSYYIFNVRASAIRGKFVELRELRILEDIKKMWQEEKIVTLDAEFDKWQNPDVQTWYDYVDSLERDDKEDIYRCLNKIKSDYES